MVETAAVRGGMRIMSYERDEERASLAKRDYELTPES